MNLEIFIFPYWFLFASLIVGAIFIHKMKIIPTLKKYGRDYEDYWSYRKKKEQLEDYINLCKEKGLTDKYWLYMKHYNKLAFVLFIGWLILLYLTEKQ